MNVAVGIGIWLVAGTLTMLALVAGQLSEGETINTRQTTFWSVLWPFTWLVVLVYVVVAIFNWVKRGS